MLHDIKYLYSNATFWWNGGQENQDHFCPLKGVTKLTIILVPFYFRMVCALSILELKKEQLCVLLGGGEGNFFLLIGGDFR